MKNIQQKPFVGTLFAMMILGSVAQANDHWVSATLGSDTRWQLHGRGGVSLGTVADQLNCSTCARTEAEGGMLLGVDALRQVSEDLWVGLAADFTTIIFGAQQTHSGVVFGQTRDFGALHTSIFAEAGVHTVQGFAGGFLEIAGSFPENS